MRRFLFFVLLFGWCVTAPSVSSAQESGVVEQVRMHYQNLEYEQAERRALRAIDNADVYDVDELAELHSLLALIYFVQQNEAKARAEFLTALSLHPDMALDPVLVPPRALSFFESVREEAVQEEGMELDQSRRYILLTDPRPAAALRSALLPGWGQAYKGETTKAWVFGSAYVGAVAGALTVHLLDDAEPRPEYSFATEDRGNTGRDLLIAAAAGIWLYSYLDALLHDARTRRPAPQRIQLHANPTSAGVQLVGSLRF